MLANWKLREVVVLSVLAVVFGVIYLLFLQFGNVLVGMFGLIGYDLIFGIWFIVSIIAAYIIRKPGAAVLSETIAATIEVMLGNAVGPRLILAGIIQGLGAEAAFAATKWKNYSTWVLVAAGMGSSITSFAWGYFLGGLAALTPGYVTAMFFVRLASGAILAGLLGKYISDSLAKTGALNSFPLGKEARKAKQNDEISA
ncbi:HMP/thiamine permease ykoE [Bacillus sp. 17376]|uniref:Substrate-specific component YkoE of thiamin-regulated ECF transporter for hydroxymethylpyrimidine n=1 Tax=Mesobacillus boroniphilus JCM 21738 TaxID=1294265 RepID=W4RM49_9BACI|nr:ECF transporter S component [Mesobacillus boroniphilus]ESU33902.1 HMP/thiamine permease ykoE [Bacillus sp. 17376]GAE45490.1 substrate-specific component YkoE of thiamin-regulated ECF transporter for hydroxymethylpyrimidine [Mesobacillus boroniphilus JCM 21738]